MSHVSWLCMITDASDLRRWRRDFPARCRPAFWLPGHWRQVAMATVCTAVMRPFAKLVRSESGCCVCSGWTTVCQACCTTVSTCSTSSTSSTEQNTRPMWRSSHPAVRCSLPTHSDAALWLVSRWQVRLLHSLRYLSAITVLHSVLRRCAWPTAIIVLAFVTATQSCVGYTAPVTISPLTHRTLSIRDTCRTEQDANSIIQQGR